jgi:hypothetical protein
LTRVKNHTNIVVNWLEVTMDSPHSLGEKPLGSMISLNQAAKMTSFDETNVDRKTGALPFKYVCYFPVFGTKRQRLALAGHRQPAKSEP